MDIETDQEFVIGDVVTFKAYEKAIKAKVKRVYRGFGGFSDNNRITYELSGINSPLISQCTGNSIIESKYYKCLDSYLAFLGNY